MATTVVQWCFLAGAAMLGYGGYGAWWLIPLTVSMAIFSWLTDRYWQLRFYDIYGYKDWARFWIETLAGLGAFVVVAFFIGRFVRHAADRL